MPPITPNLHTKVAGRPMLGALELLLGDDRLFGGNPEQWLPALLVASSRGGLREPALIKPRAMGSITCLGCAPASNAA